MSTKFNNNILIYIPNDLFGLICKFLDYKDLVFLSSVNNLFRSGCPRDPETSKNIENNSAITHALKVLLASRWGYPMELLVRKQLSVRKLTRILAFAKPIINGLVSEDKHLKCNDNTAVFIGIVGIGNRSVVASQPIPQLQKLVKSTSGGIRDELLKNIFDVVGYFTCSRYFYCAYFC